MGRSGFPREVPHDHGEIDALRAELAEHVEAPHGLPPIAGGALDVPPVVTRKLWKGVAWALGLMLLGGNLGYDLWRVLAHR